jgi:hypothetical protein
MDRFDQYIELFKWFISSVAIVVVTLIIDTGFRERETGINEMKLYSDYVDVILKANNIEERYKLADYFATVTPTDRLRVRWIEYRNTIVESYMEFQTLKIKEAQLLASNKDVSKELIEIQNKMKKHEGGLVGSHNIELATEWEANGFDFLIKKDVVSAIDAFKKSEESFHGFHSVHEIYLYLSRNKLVLNNQDSKGWKKVYREILKRYSWKMPEEQKSILNKLAYGE